MAVSEQELTSLAATHDIISLGMLADDLRRQRHRQEHDLRSRRRRAGRTRGAGLDSCRRRGSADRRRARQPRARRSSASAKSRPPPTATPCPAFRWRISKQLAARESVTLRALLEELRAAGLELVAEAPFDRLQDPRRSDRGSEHRRPVAGAAHDPSARLGRSAAAAESGRRSAARRCRHPRVRAAAAPRQPCRADHRLRRCQARGAGAAGRRQHPVDPGGLVALRSEARAGRAHRRRRRCGCGVGGRRDHRGAPPRAARGDPPQHPRGRAGAGRAQRPLRAMPSHARDERPQ